MFLDRWRPGQGRADRFTGGVGLNPFMGKGKGEDGPDALPELPAGAWLVCPDGQERGQHVGAGDAVDGGVSEHRMGVGRQLRPRVAHRLESAPRGSVRLNVQFGDRLETWRGWGLFRLFSECCGLLAGLRERDRGIPAKAPVCPLPTFSDSQYPGL